MADKTPLELIEEMQARSTELAEMARKAAQPKSTASETAQRSTPTNETGGDANGNKGQVTDDSPQRKAPADPATETERQPAGFWETFLGQKS